MEPHHIVALIPAGLVVLVAALLLLIQVRKLRRERSLVAALQAEAASLRAENQRLLPYSKIADAEETAHRIMRDARDAAARVAQDQERRLKEAREAVEVARADAKVIVDDATAQATLLIEGAKAMRAEMAAAGKAEAASLTSDARAQAETLVVAARREAARLVAEAERRAEETAGQALKALREADRLEDTVKALRNRIEGYGDEYLVPGVTLLDRLAEDYDFTKASQDYKLVKERARQMTMSGQAAACDYVEPNRRETAVRFVADAFNGKVETALSRLKADNYGKLRQEIIDAFSLVNFNGQAFRSARVTQEYLDLRLEELRLGVVLHELRLADMAEQKRIKDRIREEQRAQREFERALREAAKEEDVLKRAMEKARAAYEAASEEQKQRHEAQLREVERRLAEAEARSQRALSMAQQTRSGHVYVISNLGSFGEDVFKIGMTRRLEPLDRIRELGDASVPFEFDVHAMIFSEDAPALERELQKRFALRQVNKVNPRKEFFRVPIADLREAVEERGVGEVHWTMAAEARHFRETLAIERRLAADPAAAQAWLAEQGARIELTRTEEEEEEAEEGLVA
jgi:hypothetical protein